MVEGGREMICPKCGMETSPLDNGPCLLCKTTHSDLEKIEPISGIIIESRWSPPSPSEFTVKLNEVIEKVNRIMEVMNRR